LELVLSGKIKLGDFVEQHPLDSINEVFEDVHAHRLNRRAVLVP
jgi:6-hydroxycyclohex-1-ene-1-carbonyl-CoA dehydrogenase